MHLHLGRINNLNIEGVTGCGRAIYRCYNCWHTAKGSSKINRVLSCCSACHGKTSAGTYGAIIQHSSMNNPTSSQRHPVGSIMILEFIISRVVIESSCLSPSNRVVGEFLEIHHPIYSRHIIVSHDKDAGFQFLIHPMG